MWILIDEETDLYRFDAGQDIWRDKKYTFKQGNFEFDINLDDYSGADILDMIEPWGYTGDPELNFYQDEWTSELVSFDIIAQCIFESEANDEEMSRINKYKNEK